MVDGVLTRSWATRMKHRNRVEKLLCYRCGLEIHVGQRIHTNYRSGNPIKPRQWRPRKVYHESCYSEMYLDV
jgi:hypothetical protein